MHITIFFHEYKVLCLSSNCFLSSSIAHSRIRDDAYQIGESRIVGGTCRPTCGRDHVSFLCHVRSRYCSHVERAKIASRSLSAVATTDLLQCRLFPQARCNKIRFFFSVVFSRCSISFVKRSCALSSLF
jgi:hypothetical protein